VIDGRVRDREGFRLVRYVMGCAATNDYLQLSDPTCYRPDFHGLQFSAVTISDSDE
jgi:hypothetical protein